MNITRLSIKRPIGICMFVTLFLVLGIFSYFKMGVEFMPAINTPYVTVTVNYPGAGVESIEQQVIKPIEDALSSISDLKHMTSVAKQGKAVITLELNMNADADFSTIDATKKINAIRKELPDDIDEPVVIKRDVNAEPIIEISVTSPYSLSDTYTKVDANFKQKLQQTEGVAEVVLKGGRDKEIAINVDKDRLNAYGVTLSNIITQLQKENTLLAPGTVYSERMQSDIRIDAQFKTPYEINNIEVKNNAGIYVPITEIADINEQEKRATRHSRMNGADAISMEVYKNSDANLVDTAEGVHKQLESLRKANPDYQFNVISDQSVYVKNSLNNTLGTLVEGLFTTSLVLYFFLHGWRSAAAVAVAIPTALISTFFAMYILGFTFNMMSLMGMILCIGILVDDSIVVIENIHRFLKKGFPADVAAEEGRNEIGMAAIAITLCDVVVFLPIAFMSGLTGQVFKQFGLTIVFATLFSLLISFTLTPMLASKFFKNVDPEPKGKLWKKMDAAEQTIISKYEKILIWSLDHRKKVIVSALCVFIFAMSFIPLGIIGSEYMPRTDESSFRIYAELPVGYNMDQTKEVLAQYEEYLATLPEVKYYLSTIDTPSNMGIISVQLVNRSQRDKSIWDITSEVRKFSKKNAPNIKLRVNEIQSSTVGVSGNMSDSGPIAPLQVVLTDSDMNRLIEVSEEVTQILRSTEGVTDVKSTYTTGVPELQLNIDRQKIKYYKASVSDITNSFSAAIAGKTAGVFVNNPNNGGQDTDITVKLDNSDGFNSQDLLSVPINSNNKTLFLSDVATITEGSGPANIRHLDKKRAITVFGNVTDKPLSEVIETVTKSINERDFKVDYNFSGQANTMKETFSEMYMALGMALILIYILLAILYESLLTPIIRMFSLPLGLIGSFFFLYVTNNTINLYSLIGILVMDGVVAKNGTLLLDHTLTLLDSGMLARDAVVQAAKTRLKPIFMTTITMIVGMLPTAMAMTDGSETRSSMALVIIGGLITSTVFTMIIIPIIFLYFQKNLVKSA